MRYLVLIALVLTACGQVAPPALSSSPVPMSADACHVSGVTYCVLNSDVTPATISSTICVSGWTATIRPPASYTSQLKQQQIAAEHLVDTNPADYEEDHRLPLELGGAPRDPQNLSPELRPGAGLKDQAENEAKQKVCAGADLRQIQNQFVATWLAAYPDYKQ